MRNGNWGTALRVLVVVAALSCSSALLAKTWIWDGFNTSEKLSGKAFTTLKLTKDPTGQVAGNKVLWTPKMEKGAKPSADSAIYNINIPADGDYYLWARVRWASGCGNTFYITAPGTAQAILGGDGTYDALHWVNWIDAGKPKKLSLHKGVNTITLGARESGTMVNQFLLTDDAKYRPAAAYFATPGFVKPASGK